MPNPSAPDRALGLGPAQQPDHFPSGSANHANVTGRNPDRPDQLLPPIRRPGSSETAPSSTSTVEHRVAPVVAERRDVTGMALRTPGLNIDAGPAA